MQTLERRKQRQVVKRPDPLPEVDVRAARGGAVIEFGSSSEAFDTTHTHTMTCYYKRSTTQYHVYYFYDADRIIKQYLPREWFGIARDYGLKIASGPTNVPPPGVLTMAATIADVAKGLSG